MFVAILLIIFIFINILDAHATYHVVSHSSYRSEHNPIARFLFKRLGLVPGILVLKSIIIVVIFLIVKYYIFLRTEILIILVIANVVYGIIVKKNYQHYRKLKQRYYRYW
ncbi:MAG: DUF5658 family protein [Candidatus Cloacimonadia bacterium]